jgi:hypothetical protein
MRCAMYDVLETAEQQNPRVRGLVLEWPGAVDPTCPDSYYRTVTNIVTRQGYPPPKDFPQTLRGIRYNESETSKRLLYIPHNAVSPALINYASYTAHQ